MNGSAKIRPAHRQRQAVVYLRQSSPKQVLHHRESVINQRALGDRLLELGWQPDQVVVLDDDQGLSAKSVVGREGFQRLVADVGLGKVGIIMGYEVSRLARNNADWHRLLELCALFDTLLGDADGIYTPRDFNDRLLLGLKGTMSEAELHSLRLRLDAGRLSQARRGQLVQHLPTGYVRVSDGTVTLDPDIGVQERIRLVFRKFLELGSAHKVLMYLTRNGLLLPRRQTSGLHAGEILWRNATLDSLHSMLKNPAYAGAFAYGRRIVEPTRQVPGRPATGRIRKSRTEWLALVQGVYPAYITWKEYDRIQELLQENRQKMQEQMSRKQGLRQGAALLTGLVRCGHCGRHLNVAYKEGRFQYNCDSGRRRYAQPSCQHLPGERIDAVVVQEFLAVLQPAQIDVLEQVGAREAEHQRELVNHLEKDVARAEYDAHRAERQYNCVDPENRLIAATLEKKWEAALRELEQAKERLTRALQTSPRVATIPAELREAFADVGRRLPELWPELSLEAKKRLLRTMVSGVNLRRQENGMVQVRIVWRGGLVTEVEVRLPLASQRYSQAEERVVARLRELAQQGLSAKQIAEALNAEGYKPCRRETFTDKIVIFLQGRYGIILNLEKVRRGEVPGKYTVREMAGLLKVQTCWIYRKISEGRIDMAKDAQYGCYLFPRTRRVVQKMKQMRKGVILQLSFRKEHSNG